MLKIYEGMFLIRGELSDEKRDSVINSICEGIEKVKGEIISKGFWEERRRLAYPIKKEREASYYLVNFKISPDLISKLRQGYRLNENILRSLILRQEK